MRLICQFREGYGVQSAVQPNPKHVHISNGLTKNIQRDTGICCLIRKTDHLASTRALPLRMSPLPRKQGSPVVDPAKIRYHAPGSVTVAARELTSTDIAILMRTRNVYATWRSNRIIRVILCRPFLVFYT